MEAVPWAKTYICMHPRVHDVQSQLRQTEFVTRVAVVRERMSSKELEVTGKWFTEEKLKQSGDYSTQLVDVCSILTPMPLT